MKHFTLMYVTMLIKLTISAVFYAGVATADEYSVNAAALSGSNSNSSSSSGSTAISDQTQIQGQEVQTSNAQGQTLIYAPVNNESSERRISYSGTNTLRTAPTNIAPNIGTTNPCIVPVSGGLSVIGGAFSFGSGMEDTGCTMRANAARLAELGMKNAAIELMCSDEKVKEAMARSGTPCANPASEVPKTTGTRVYESNQEVVSSYDDSAYSVD